MDPLSIACAAGGVAKLAFSCGTSLYSFISGVSNVDGNVKALYDEVAALKDTARSVQSMLERPDLQAFNDPALWADATASLKASEESLRRLDACLRGLRVKPTSSNPFSRGRTQIKLNMKDEDIMKSRAKLHSHRLGLQTIVQLIGVHISGAAPAMLLDEFVPRLNTIIKLLRDDEQRIRGTNQDLDDIETVILHNNDRLAQSAQVVLNDLVSAADDGRSTIFGGTEMSLNFECTAGGIPLSYRPRLHEVAQGGASLNHINSWVASAESSSTIAPSNAGARRKPPAPAMEDAAGHPAPTLGSLPNVYDSDDDTDRDLLERYLHLASTAAAVGKHDRAETFLKKALQNPNLLASLPAPVQQDDVKLKLLSTLFARRKNEEARPLCEELVKIKINNDDDRNRVLEASFVLAQLHLSEAAFDDAQRHCRQVIKGRQALNGKTSDQYYAALALMAFIHGARGDEADREAYETLLPANFEKPSFRGPGSPRTGADPGGARMDLRNSTESTSPTLVESYPPLSRDEARLLLDSVNIYGGIEIGKLTALHCAAAQRDDAAIERLSKTYNINDIRGVKKLTPLHIAAMCGHHTTVKVLVKKGADIRQGDCQGYSALHYAARRGHVEVAKVLLDNGANIEAENDARLTPLHWACYNGHEGVAKLLIDRGANVNVRRDGGWTPLHWAASNGKEKVVRLLLECGADKKQRDEFGTTALDLAKECGHAEIVKVLKSR